MPSDTEIPSDDIVICHLTDAEFNRADEDETWVRAWTGVYRSSGSSRVPVDINRAYNCADCGQWFLDTVESGNNAYDETVCSRCVEEYSSCDNCGCTCHSDNLHYHEPSSETLCELCYNERNTDEYLIHDYSFRPRPAFYPHKAENTAYYGVEIEVDRQYPADCRSEDIRSSGLADDEAFYCKEDGSLHNGFEIVSHPATWEWWAEKDMDFLVNLKQDGYRSYNTDTCGMHVHVSRDIFTRTELHNLLRFARNNKDFLRFLSRRKEYNLNRWARVDDGDDDKLIRKVDARPEERYEAINLVPQRTIEFRIFRGTLDVLAAKRNIALVASLVGFIKSTTASRITLGDYRKWLAKDGLKTLGKNDVTRALIKWVRSYRVGLMSSDAE